MDGTLKKVVSWSIFGIILLVVIVGVIIPCIILTYGPALYPDSDFSSFEDSLQFTSIILSFASVFLGGFSIYQASVSSKETKVLQERVDTLKSKQEEMNNLLRYKKFEMVESQPTAWTPDPSNME